METNKRKDLLTGEEFIPKKVSQQFATPQNRIKFYNRKASLEKQKRAIYDKPLLTNYRILLDMMENKTSVIYKKDFMLGKGFDFRIFNHFMPISGINYPSINEFTLIIEKDNPDIKIIKND
ncbi:hypothetical protein ACFPVY_03105 [Flavobacterium qiangtangense]|uniref:Uncharacterized protein n=1 Tax=Flavobacterium qiangtangense TaxID=1442595 RepID=A0ABW1PJ21_9FLAO